MASWHKDILCQMRIAKSVPVQIMDFDTRQWEMLMRL